MKKKLLISLILMFAVVLQGTFAFAAVSVSGYTGKEYTHSERFDDYLRVDGIDVSQWNGTIDWQKVKADGIDYALIRIGGRGYAEAGRLYFDDNYAAYIKEAKAAGLIVGVYYFSQAITEAEAVEEANHALDLLRSENLNLPVFMDYEFAGESGGRLVNANLTKSQATAIAEKWCQTIEAAGYEAGLYANLDYLNNNISADSLGINRLIWAAQYYGMCEYEGRYNMWQYSDSGQVDGISGNTDSNFWYIEKMPLSEGEKSLAGCDVTLQGNGTYLYDDSYAKPTATVTYGETTLVEGTDYMIGYIDNDAIGTAYAYISGLGDYSGYKLVEFEITNQLPDDIITGDIITSTEYTFDDYIRGVDFQTTVEDFEAAITLAEGYTCKLTDDVDSGEVTSGNVGTGMRLHVYDSTGEEAGCQTVVIKGDCDGDGRCSVFDLVYARQAVAKMKELSDARIDALDVRIDGKVSVFDLVVMEQHVAKLKPIEN